MQLYITWRDFIKKKVYQGNNVTITLNGQNLHRCKKEKPVPQILSLAHLFSSDIASILHLRKRCHATGKDRLLIAKNSQMMKKYFRFYHNFEIKDFYRITVSHFCKVSRKKMASLFTKELSFHNADRNIIGFIVNRMSIVYKHAPSKKDILESSNTPAEHFSRDNPPLSACEYVK